MAAAAHHAVERVAAAEADVVAVDAAAANLIEVSVASTSDHTPQTRGPALMRMQWRHLLFMHWPIPASALRSLIPSSLEIDEFDGTAWVGLIPFTMRDVLPRLVPRIRPLCDIRSLSCFHECNVRTYVTPKGGGIPGVWFFSLDAASRAGVWTARRFFHLRYFHARIHLDRRDDVVRYSVDRLQSPKAQMRCAWRIGPSLPQSKPGDLAHFLTERYALYTTNSAGALHRCRIWHEPWQLRAAKLISLDDELVRAAGIHIDQSQPPILHHSDELNMRAWRLERV